ncbi:fumarylacetoacetate hydrolase family protein [Fictibacillus enclensis]|uniref:2-keto-4-pentenoate hydratase n=1 Tax=Fictibacillus enclensis TaxID=1017270 RepID=UPI0025A05893|nr:fumarylacetoacetate hydrolase family protein [Fictibacillus enclensis]MDM5196702.1 fumarylacetoacetate hydrolase family protein [Fictibacillus enclensis]
MSVSLESSLTADQIEQLAVLCKDAEEQAHEITKLTDEFPNLSVDEAYAVQQKLIHLKQAEGKKVIGRKLGLTSVAKQQMMGVHEPTYGTLFDYMMLSETEPVDLSSLIHPKAEPEIAFYMGEHLEGSNVTGIQVLSATKYVMPAIEIIDSRYKDFRFTLPDVVADNSSSSRVVLGGKATRVEEIDLSLLGVVFYKNGNLESTGAGAAVLGHPATAVAWLVNKLYLQGEKLRKGDLVLSGAITGAYSIQPGDHVDVRIEKLGNVTIHCK